MGGVIWAKRIFEGFDTRTITILTTRRKKFLFFSLHLLNEYG
jgi:hypothetical protein